MWLSFLFGGHGGGPSPRNPFHQSQQAAAPKPALETPLHEAAASGDTERLLTMLSEGHNPNARVLLKPSPEAHTALHYAASAGHLAAVHALKRAGAECTLPELALLSRELYTAAVLRKHAVIQALRAAGAGLSGPCSEVLYANAWGGELDAVQCWVAAGAVLGGEQLERGGQELASAVLAADLPRVQRWLAAGVDPCAAKDAKGRSALDVATAELAAGADPTIARMLREMPLQLAAERCHVAKLRALLASGAAEQMAREDRAQLLATALEAGVRGDWLAALLEEEYIPPQHLQLWAAAAYGNQQHGLRWAQAGLLSLGRCGLPLEVAQRTLALGMV